IDRVPGFRRMEAHDDTPIPQYRVQAPARPGVLGGETLHALAKRHDISRNVIRVWVEKYEAGALNDALKAQAPQYPLSAEFWPPVGPDNELEGSVHYVYVRFAALESLGCGRRLATDHAAVGRIAGRPGDRAAWP